MLQTTPVMPARGGAPRPLTGIINTVVGQITVMTADQLPDLAESTPRPVRRTPTPEVAQLTEDRDRWMSAVDTFSRDDAREWNDHKEKLKVIPNMSRAEKIELFGRLRQLACSYGIDFDQAARLFIVMPF